MQGGVGNRVGKETTVRLQSTRSEVASRLNMQGSEVDWYRPKYVYRSNPPTRPLTVAEMRLTFAFSDKNMCDRRRFFTSKLRNCWQ